MKSRIWTKWYQWCELSNITQFFENWKCFKNYRWEYKIWVIVHNEIISGKMDSFQTYPGLMAQKSVRWSRKSLPFMVPHELSTITWPPLLSGSRIIDGILAQGSTCGFDVSMSIWSESSVVVDVDLPSRPMHNSRLSVEVSHDNSFWS